MSAPAQAAFRRHRGLFNNLPSGVGKCRSRLGLRFDKPYQTILERAQGLGARRVLCNTLRPNCIGLLHFPVLPPASFPKIRYVIRPHRLVQAQGNQGGGKPFDCLFHGFTSVLV